MLSSDVQPLNIYLPKVVTPSCSVTDARLVQPSNRLSGRDVTLPGIVIDLSAVHP